MKLIIEHKKSLSACIGSKGSPTIIEGPVTRLNYVSEQQLLSKWCWAAIAVSMSHYYYKEKWRQEEVATTLLKFDCQLFRDSHEVAEACNKDLLLNDALQLTQTYSHWSPGRPAFERIKHEIHCGRPLCPRIEWRNGGAHYVVVKGYNENEQSLLIADSLHGTSEIPYRDFPSKYNNENGAAWTETFWTNVDRSKATLQIVSPHKPD